MGSNATDSCANRPARVTGWPLAGPPTGTSKMKPCGFFSGTLDTLVKSGPTSGPLIVSSQDIQAPHGIGPPEQFIWVPLRLVAECTTSPNRVTSVVVVPPRAIESYGVVGPKGVPGPLISWLRISTTLLPLP